MMSKFIRSLLVLSAVLALSFSQGCKNPKTPLTPIPNNPQGIGQASPTGPSKNAGNLAGTGANNSGTFRGGNNGSGVDDIDSVLTTDEGGTEQGNREFFEGRAMDYETLSAYTIHFDFDSSTVRPADAASVKAVADFLLAHPDHALLVEGHCDERGTEEYNQSLGERRAISGREAVSKAGVPAGHISTKSWGEAKPVALGTDAASYAANRRGVFVLLLPKDAAAAPAPDVIE